MQLTYAHLTGYPKVLKSMTGLTRREFDQLLDEIVRSMPRRKNAA